MPLPRGKGNSAPFIGSELESAAEVDRSWPAPKFAAIFGKLDSNTQRVDLGDKVFYRVRVGPFALADAQKICGSYKAVGGSDCLIARH
jgi:hypothetical protein